MRLEQRPGLTAPVLPEAPLGAGNSLATLFGATAGHWPTPLRPATHASLLWLNSRAAALDPACQALGGNMTAYAAHLLSCCAWLVDDEPSAIRSKAAAMGHADRYGGSGVGNNGGSGRSVVVNGYLVKGAGRTGLVSALTPASHASGGAYLEEAVREVIFSEVVAAEFPHSAVPVLALIDTGLVQRWNLDHGPASERRVLVVRPCVLRAAHFERSVGFQSGQSCEGLRDTERVRRMFALAADQLGAAELEGAFIGFGDRVAAQLAHGFVHRLPHGSPNTSNVALDGRLLDFGAMSAVPSWADVATMLTRQPFHHLFRMVSGSIHSLAYQVGRHFLPQFSRPDFVRSLVSNAQFAFQRTVLREALHLGGARRCDTAAFDSATAINAAWPSLMEAITHFQRERLEFVDGAPAPALAWDLPLLWHRSPPAHLQGLRNLLRDLVPSVDHSTAAERCMRMARTRRRLYREPMKARLHRALELSPARQLTNQQQLARFVAREIGASSRAPSGDW